MAGQPPPSEYRTNENVLMPAGGAVGRAIKTGLNIAVTIVPVNPPRHGDTKKAAVKSWFRLAWCARSTIAIPAD